MARRSGGRRTRLAQRSAPLEDVFKPVRTSESGGQFKHLSDHDLEAINNNSARWLHRKKQTMEI